jgi:hypothetical protein
MLLYLSDYGVLPYRNSNIGRSPSLSLITYRLLAFIAIVSTVILFKFFCQYDDNINDRLTLFLNKSIFVLL